MLWKVHRNTCTVSALFAGMLMNPAALLAQEGGTAARAAELDAQLAQSEARVRVLQQQVEQLEARLDALVRGQVAGRPGPGPQGGAQVGTGPRMAPPQHVAQARPATPGGPGGMHAGPGPGPARRPGPGSFEVDEDSAQRALERTLTQSGALLLPPGAFTLTPGFSFVRAESTTAVLAQVTDPGTGNTSPVLLDRNLKRNEFALGASLKAGLPWESQLELDLPLNYVRASRTDAFGTDDSGNGSGFGDLEIGIAKTLLRERGALPDLIGRLTYNTGTGRRVDDRVTLPGGYRGLTAEIVALKRQDPLAFFAAASYGVSREEGGIKPGNLANLSFGTVLAASPATSLQFGFTQTYRQRQELNGVKQAGSSQTYGTFSIGASSVLSRDMMLITSLGIGVGDDAPRYSLNVRLPITFR